MGQYLSSTYSKHVTSVYFTDSNCIITVVRLSVAVSCFIERILASHEVESIVLAFYESFILEWDEETQQGRACTQNWEEAGRALKPKMHLSVNLSNYAETIILRDSA